MNKHDFQQMAKKFRAGRITLEQFSDNLFTVGNERGEKSPSQITPPSQVTPTQQTTPTQLPERTPDSHKGDYGRVLAIGGSEGMAGAISLSGLAALKSGSGLVIVAIPKKIQDVVAGFSPCYMTVGCLDKNGHFAKEALDEILERCYWADVIAVGPGMGKSKALQKIMVRLYQELAQPMVVDADGLNNLADAEFDFASHEGLRVLTPHPGEFRRLIQSSATDRVTLEKEAIEFASRHQVTIVLKGHRTLITNGQEIYHNATGNPGMATAGSGDILTGVIASFVAAGLSSVDAARYGAEVHGRAGDLAAKRQGQVSMVATDILDALGSAIQMKE